MNVVLEIPEEIAARIPGGPKNLSRRALEALAVDFFRQRVIGWPQVAQMLGFTSRIETEDFLGVHQVWPRYEAADAESDLKKLDQMEPS